MRPKTFSNVPLRLILCRSIAWLSLFPISHSAVAEGKLGFNRDIRGVLSDKCFACHGPDAETVEGGLRLDLRHEAVEESGAIVPGQSSESEMIRRILSDDPDEVMPPPQSHKPLNEAEKSLLARWIDEGAVYEKHWAYEPMLPLPQNPDSDASGSSAPLTSQTIDRLINQQIEGQGLSPAPPADRITLIRRLCYDLTGIPPTSEEVQAFLDNPSETAYGELVDRLLDSPRYGERMASYWLDLVRYADTVGYHGDQNVSQSPYRDYVINAFNENLPYDQFVREQLAGDLLPDASLNQIVASGYNRLNQTTEEGGSQAKEYLAIYFADRVRNVSQVFMGATMGCAQCHDHKYDPYTMKDFYSLGAFFADLDERGVYGARSRPPSMRVPGNELQQQLETMDKEIAKLKSQVAPLQDRLAAAQPEWEERTRGKLEEAREIETAWVDDSLTVKANQRDAWNFVGGDDVPVHRGQKSRRQQSDGLIQHLFDSMNPKHSVTQNTRFYCWVHLDPENPPAAVMIQLNDGNWNHRKVWGSDDIPYGRQEKSHPAYQRGGKLPESGEWVRLEVTAEEVGLAKGAEVQAMAFTQFGGLAHWDDAGVIMTDGIPGDVADALKLVTSERSEAQRQVVRDFYLANAEPMKSLQETIKQRQTERQSAFDSAPQTVISKSVAPRTIRILPRGNWMDDSGEVVGPAIPEFLGTLDTGDRRPSRVDLADWICRDDNPLTARTMANRIWSQLFGRGICSSVDDFGGQGTYPSNPELLDALAIEFVRSGWDVKSLIRLIVLSDTYRRSSTPGAELADGDPYNDLFARQGRFCVSAEAVRDGALSISGLLVEQLGGQSVRPYQPAGYYAQLNFPRRTYQADNGANQYRRGIYTHWQRTFLHPMLKAFDAPSREECTASRSRSNTPLQALVLLNDPTFVEAARVFAQRIMKESDGTVDSKIRWAYRTAVSRDPESEIVDQISQVYRSHLKHYQQNPEAAAQLIGHGMAPADDRLQPTELAAWTSVARVILNLHETITRY